MSVIPSKPSAAELASASAWSKFPVCLSVWSSQAPGQQQEKAERETKPVPNLEQDRRKTGEINKTKKKKKQLVIGGRQGPSLRSSGCMCAHQASHGDAVNHCSAPHTLGHTLCIWPLQSIFVRVPGIPANSLIAIKGLAGPMLLPKWCRVFCSNLSGTPELKVSTDHRKI